MWEMVPPRGQGGSRPRGWEGGAGRARGRAAGKGRARGRTAPRGGLRIGKMGRVGGHKIDYKIEVHMYIEFTSTTPLEIRS